MESPGLQHHSDQIKKNKMTEKLENENVELSHLHEILLCNSANDIGDIIDSAISINDETKTSSLNVCVTSKDKTMKSYYM